MKPSTFNALPSSITTLTPTSTTDVKTFTVPLGMSAFWITAETNDGRITVDGTTPSATVGHKVPKDQFPQLVLLGPGTVLKCVSTAAGNSVVQVTPLQ